MLRNLWNKLRKPKDPESLIQPQIRELQYKEELKEERERAAVNLLSPTQIEEVISNNTDIDFLRSEMKKKMNKVDIPYIINQLKPIIKDRPKKNIDPKEIVIGNIIGDIIGSKYEGIHHNYELSKTEPLPPKHSKYTDDTVLSIATMKAIMEAPDQPDYRKHYIEMYHKYPRAGYGPSFIDWALNEIDNTKGYHSIGNGAAMRLSFIPAYYEDLDRVMEETVNSVMPTHNHIESVKYSLVLSVCLWMLLHNYDKKEIEEYCNKHCRTDPKLYYSDYHYEWDKPLTDIKVKNSLMINYAVPYAIKCFLETNSYEECMREILSRFGDTDTICAIAGGLCIAYYGETGLDNEKILRDHNVPIE